jgi:hypothetical protein
MRLQGPVPWKKDSTTGSESHESRDVPTEELLPTDLGIVRHYYSTALHDVWKKAQRVWVGRPVEVEAHAHTSPGRVVHNEPSWSVTSESVDRFFDHPRRVRNARTPARILPIIIVAPHHDPSIHPSMRLCQRVPVCLSTHAFLRSQQDCNHQP